VGDKGHQVVQVAPGVMVPVGQAPPPRPLPGARAPLPAWAGLIAERLMRLERRADEDRRTIAALGSQLAIMRARVDILAAPIPPEC